MKIKYILSFTMLLCIACLPACDKGDDEQADLSVIEYTLTADEAGINADIEYTSGFGLIRLED